MAAAEGAAGALSFAIASRSSRADGNLAEGLFMAFFEKASPADFRHLAAKDREKGNHELAYLFEMCADHRERGEI